MAKEDLNDVEKGLDGEEVRVTVLINKSILEKIKVIAKLQNTMSKNVIQEALLERIKKYESENNPIKISETEGYENG